MFSSRRTRVVDLILEPAQRASLLVNAALFTREKTAACPVMIFLRIANDCSTSLRSS